MLSNSNKASIVASFSTREKQLELLPYLKSESSRFMLILESSLLTDSDKWHIAKGFRSDERIAEIAKDIKDQRISSDLYLRMKDHNTIGEFAPFIKDQDVFNKLISRFSEKELKEWVDTFSNEPFVLNVLAKIKDYKWVINKIEALNTNDIIPFNMEHFVEIYSIVYKLNKEHLTRFVQKFGIEAFKSIANNNIKKAINLDDADFEKYLKIFNEKHFIGDEKNLKDFIFAFAQQKYKTSNNSIINIFALTLHALEDNDLMGTLKQLNIIVSLAKIPLEEWQKMLNTNVSNVKKVPEIFLERLVDKNNAEAINLLHKVADKAIDNHRNNVVKSTSRSSLQVVPRVLSERAMMDYLIYEFDVSRIQYLFSAYFRLLSSDEEELIKNSKRLNEVIDFKKSPNGQKMTEQLKKDLFSFTKIVNKLYPILAKKDRFQGVLFHYPFLETKYSFDNSKNYEYILSIMQQINPEQMKDKVFTNDELFHSLLGFLSETRIAGLEQALEYASDCAGIPLDDSAIASLIGNYAEIIAQLKAKEQTVENSDRSKVGPIDYLIEASYYDSESYRYENLFGQEVYKYIKCNPSPNSASVARKKRIDSAVKLVRKVVKRNTLSVPPQDKDYQTSKGRKINVKIGDVSNLENLVYGEKTGACMRIGGARETLFDFCLLNDNGFHMVFSDPETGRFISRVSGFRNGNTVFFNELRNSVDLSISDKELYSIMKKASEFMIEQSKNSTFPIENVVVSPYYAATGLETNDLGISNINKGIGDFYSDIDGKNAVIVATSATDAKFAPVVLEKQTELYEGLILEPKHYIGRLAYNKIVHLETLRQFLDGTPLEQIDIKEEVCECYATSDWGIYLDNKGNIKLVIANKNKKTMEQIKNVSEELKTKLMNSSQMEGNNAKGR